MQTNLLHELPPSGPKPFEVTARSVIDTSQWFTIATASRGVPHLAACWTRNILALGYTNSQIVVPVWHLHETESNLLEDPRMELLFVSSEIERSKGKGQGLTVAGLGVVLREGPRVEQAREVLEWIHGVLVVSVVSWKLHLP